MKNLIQTEQSNWAVLILNRPSKKNALDLDLIQNLIDAFSDLKKNPNIRGILLKGKGSSFCAGADLNWMISSSFDPHLLFNLFHTIETCDQPVIAQVQGPVYGGGIGLISVCDFICAENESSFCFSELKWGLTPAVIAPFILKKISFNQARYFLLTAQMFTAKTAFNIHLIDYFNSIEDCQKWTSQIIKNINSLNQASFKKTKNLLRKIPLLNKEEIKNVSIQYLTERLSQHEVRKKISAFFKKSSL